MPRFIRLGRFAKPQAADLEQVVVVEHAPGAQGMDAVLDHLAHQSHVLFYLHPLLLRKRRQHIIHLLLPLSICFAAPAAPGAVSGSRR